MFPTPPSRRPGADSAAGAQPDLAVLDTQVVLDWLVFGDPGASEMGRAIESGSLHWLACQPMRDEIEHVLDRGVGATRRPDRAAIRVACERYALPAALAADSALRCADPDDQMFIDLALAMRVSWLFTRDNALLRLAPRARERGVHILRPADWRPPPAPPR